MPLMIRFAMLRVELVPHSMAEPGKPWDQVDAAIRVGGVANWRQRRL